MRKLLIGVCAIALVLASTTQYEVIQKPNKTIYPNSEINTEKVDKPVFGQKEIDKPVINQTIRTRDESQHSGGQSRDGSDLFFSEYAEGSSNNKYLEIFNPTSDVIDLSGYFLANVSNAPTDVGEWEYTMDFDAGVVVYPGDVFVVCHGSSSDEIMAECDQTHNYLSNGDDGYGLFKSDGTAIDWLGDFNGDPGSEWNVCGVGGTKDHTLVRNSNVTSGNEWAVSSNDITCEWAVYDQNEWSYLGFHDYDGSGNDDVDLEADCAAIGGFYCGDDESNWTSWSPNGCVVSSYICDGYGDCADASDEAGCAAPTCADYGYASCTDPDDGSSCIYTSWVCDGYADCPDGSDEADCAPASCADQGLWDCGDGQCIPNSYVCDGSADTCNASWGPDCVNGADESLATCGDAHDECVAGCPDGYFDCLGDGSECIPNSYVCDGSSEFCNAGWGPDCSNGADEGLDVCTYTDDCVSEYVVTFDLDGLDDCGFVSVTGSFDGWSGWGAHTDNGMTVNLEDGFYEYTILCVDTSIDGWWNDIWGTSTQYSAPWGSDCDAVQGDDYPNYGFTVSGADLTVSQCAGTCDASCEPAAEPAANLFFSEASEGSSNNKYLEIYNGEGVDVDLSGYSLSSCSNGCDEVGAWDYADNVTFEAGTTVAAGDVYVVCHGSSSDEIMAECDQTFTYLSNGDDVFALTQVGSGDVLDVIGVVGEDPGSGWDVAGVSNATKDHTLVRKASVTTGNPRWLDNPDTGEPGSAGTDADNSEWVVFDQNTWDYIGFHPHDFSADVLGCMDVDACNYNADATVDDGSCASLDCQGECGGSAVCGVDVTFSVDMSIQGVSGDVKVRTSTVNGDYAPSDWFVMDDSDGDMVYTYTMTLETGVTYGYNFNDGGYESGSGLGDCAGGSYGNDRYVTPGDADMTLDTVCFGSCEACPDIVYGCTDETAINYNADATVSDDSCEYGELTSANLFISEAAEGSSNNKYIEIFNASDSDVDLSSYAYPTVGNAPTVPGEYEYWNTFPEGAVVAAGDVFVICHQSADETILAECDANYTYLSNGDDGLCLVYGSEGNFEILDCVGDWNGDPGSGWDVAGVSSATKDHTLVRKASVAQGNGGYWEASAGTEPDDSEWVVLDQNDWTYLGSHPHDFDTAVDVEGCMDSNATNYNPDATVQSYNEFDTSTCTYASCSDIPTEMGCLWEDGTSSMWWDGWWNCEGGEVCGLAKVTFELNLPDGVTGTPHVNGSYNGWCGTCYNDMALNEVTGTWTHTQYFSEGETHDYKFTIDGWNDQEDLTGLECAVEVDGYWNRQFTAGAPNTSQTLAYCWNSCEAACEVAPSCGDGVCDESEDCGSCASDCGGCPEYAVTFDLSGVEDCGFVSVTGSFDGWSGWGAHTDNGMTVTLLDGQYEYTILCVDTSVPEWWNDIWGASTQYSAPWGSECDAVQGDDYPNYGFTVSGADLTVSQCAGTCDEVCVPDCAYSGDANGDGNLNVTDIVLVVGFIINGETSDDLVCTSDVNMDGVVNVTDIVQMVSTIIND